MLKSFWVFFFARLSSATRAKQESLHKKASPTKPYILPPKPQTLHLLLDGCPDCRVVRDLLKESFRGSEEYHRYQLMGLPELEGTFRFRVSCSQGLGFRGLGFSVSSHLDVLGLGW